MRFLRYIKQWGKKVVFVVNKVDIFESPADIDEVTAFVAGNARTLLSADAAMVFPVSARLALAAKVAAGARPTLCRAIKEAGTFKGCSSCTASTCLCLLPCIASSTLQGEAIVTLPAYHVAQCCRHRMWRPVHRVRAIWGRYPQSPNVRDFRSRRRRRGAPGLAGG